MKAELALVIVPMIGDEAGESPTGGGLAVQLTEDMKANDEAALPSGTVLITQVDNVARRNGLVSQKLKKGTPFLPSRALETRFLGETGFLGVQFIYVHVLTCVS